VFFCFSSLLSAQISNNQKIIPLDSEIYQAIKALYIAQGLALPSTAGPWSQDELLLMLKRLDDTKLSADHLILYDFAAQRLTPSAQNVQFDGALTVQLFAHTNTEQFITQDLYVLHPNLARPFASFNFDFFLTNHAYGYFELPLMERVFNDLVPVPQRDVTMVQSPNHGTHTFGINTLYSDGLDLTLAVPFRTFVSLGGEGWNVQFGRDRLSWGPGESGNFLIGSQVHYHTGFRAAFYAKNLKYQYNVSNFPYPGEYYLLGDDNIDAFVPATIATRADGAEFTTMPNADVVRGINLFIAHRLEWRMFQDKIGFAFNEAVIYQSASGDISFDTFVPSMLLHNLYRNYNQNSLLTLEADFSPLPLLNFYAQIAIDEFSLPNESVPTKEKASLPDAYGFMVGTKTAFPLFKGVFAASLEYVQTDPYLYLHKYYPEAPLQYIVSNRYTDQTGHLLYAEEFLGYRWGSDAQVFNLQAEYRRLGKWQAGINLMVMIHGTHDKWTKFASVYAADSAHDPKDLVITENHKGLENYADATAKNTRNTLSYFTALSLKGSLCFLQWFTVFGQADFVFINNFGNVARQSANDIQCTVGLTYSF
jgi:hypothetical protein